MARRAKIDPNQRTFDFDFVAAMLEEREAELLQEDSDEQSSSIQSQPGPEPLNHTEGQQMPDGQPSGPGDPEPLGHQPASRVEGAGAEYGLFNDTPSGST